MNYLYDVLRLYVNFFQPSAKLVSKERIGPEVVTHYDTPKTPYQRLLESSCVDETKKNTLRQICENPNPADRKRRIDRFKRKLKRCHKQEKRSSRSCTERILFRLVFFMRQRYRFV